MTDEYDASTTDADATSPRDRDGDGMDDRLELLLTAAFAMAAASVARKVASEVWKVTTGRTPPSGSKDAGSTFAVIVLWGAVAGAAGGVARAVAERQAAKVARARRSA